MARAVVRSAPSTVVRRTLTTGAADGASVDGDSAARGVGASVMRDAIVGLRMTLSNIWKLE
ncbi:MAG: hypothetical protein O6650_02745 [Actinobacteria bacterium]|nr:hypothetical protein [Actinomycetota bacterium]